MKTHATVPSRPSVFDYTVTITRKHRYLVVGCPEFGYQIASGAIDLGQATPERIGKAVLEVLGRIQLELDRLQHGGAPIPGPRRLEGIFSGDVLSIREAARILGVSRTTLRRMVYDGKILAHRTSGGHLRFRLDTLADYLAGTPAPASSRQPAA